MYKIITDCFLFNVSEDKRKIHIAIIQSPKKKKLVNSIRINHETKIFARLMNKFNESSNNVRTNLPFIASRYRKLFRHFHVINIIDN